MNISGPSSPWLTGDSYTLICVVVADASPEVKWTDSNGKYLVENEGLTLSGPFVSGNHTILNLTFENLRTSHAGRYYCVSDGISVPVNISDWNVTIQCESDKHT